MENIQLSDGVVNASPVKSFFVSMMTRDIELEDAILDLLDNCVDGILRIGDLNGDKPYSQYWARISFDKDSFSIEDNCGGIPWRLSNYAFRLGPDPTRPPEETPLGGSVGVYGIGMKRAIFKMGESCVISTQHKTESYEVSISANWLRDEDDWNIPVATKDPDMDEDGTRIAVTNLYKGISIRFHDEKEDFKAELNDLVSTHYSFIIDKGFMVFINDDFVPSKAKGFVFTQGPDQNDRVIRPFIYQAKTDQDVDIFITVGFTGQIPSEDDVSREQEEKRNSSEQAGWTIICNDRAVLYCDRSELTGWGETGVPRYHTQFIAVSGVVEFRCEDPAKLPTTTTKRGVDASSLLYLQVKNKMREGMRLFTGYTNRWKGRADETRSQFECGEVMTFSQVKSYAQSMRLATSSTPIPGAQQFRPRLPEPRNLDPRKSRIAFSKNTEDVKVVGEYLFNDPMVGASRIGEECFDLVFKEATH